MNSADRPLQIEITPEGSAIVVALRGAASMEVCDELSQQLQEVVARNPNVIVLDLHDLNFICSLGLGNLVAAHIGAKRRHARVHIAAPQPAIADLLRITNLNELFPVFSTRAEALANA